MGAIRNSVINIFYRSIRSPRDLSSDFKITAGQPYFWLLCGLYLCLPMLIILTIVYATELLDGLEVLLIGAQVALLLPLLFLSIWLLEKLVSRIVGPDKPASAMELYWLLASNYFFMLCVPVALVVLLANLVPHRILNDPLVSIALPVIFVTFSLLWLRSAVLMIQSKTNSSLIRAIVIAIGGALAITFTAWMVIGIIAILILLPIGLIA